MRRSGTIVILFTVMLTTGMGLAAQARSGTGNLRVITIADFVFLGLQDPALYPETSLAGNPANLLRLPSTLLTSRTTVDVLRTSTTNTRTDETIGALGGTLTATESVVSPTERLGLYFALGKERQAPRLGIRFAGDLELRDKLDTYTDYRSFSEDLTVEEEEHPFSGSLDLSLGLPTKGPGLGASLGYGFGYLPALFPVQVDNTLSPVLTSYGVPVRANDVYTHQVRAAAGANLALSRAAELSMALAYAGTFQDAAKTYVAVDTDADGKSDNLMLYSDWVVSLDGVDLGGPAVPAISYSQKDLTVGTELSLSPRIRLYVSDTAELLLGGRYFVFLMSDRSQYQRPTYATDLEDNVSELRQHVDANFKSFDATLGLGLATAKDAYLKMGVTYTRRGQTLGQDGTQSNGDALYSSRNPDHYTELTLGLEPANNAIVTLLDQPTVSLTQTVSLRLGWSYLPAAGVGVFVGTVVQGTMRTDTYRAYNLDTRSVWEETVATQGLVWAVEPVAGLRVQVGKKITAGFSASGTGITGSLVSATETAPFNVELQTTTLNGAQDLTGSVPFNLSVQFDLSAAL